MLLCRKFPDGCHVEGPVTEASMEPPGRSGAWYLETGQANTLFFWLVSSVGAMGKTVQLEPQRAQSPCLWECSRITFVLAQGSAPKGVPNVCAQREVSKSTVDRRRQTARVGCL